MGSFRHSIRKRLLPLRRAVFGNRYVANVAGREMVIDLSDRGFTARFYYRRRHEKVATAVFRGLLRPGMTVLDVGANIGFYSLEADDIVGPEGRVIAFEPDPANRALLEENLERNRAQRVTVEACAVSDSRREIQLYQSRYNSGDHRIYDGSQEADFHRGGARSTITVPTRTLDDYVAEHGLEVDVVKCDIQGAERRMWDGMRTLVANRATLVLAMEFWPRGLRACGDDPVEFLAEIVAAGFDVYVAAVPEPRRVTPGQLLTELADGGHANVVLRRA